MTSAVGAGTAHPILHMLQAELKSLAIEEKIGQLFFIGLHGTELEGDAARLVDEIRPGGVCLFARNIREAAQTRALLDALRGALPVEPLLSLDQEGGLVDRLRRVVTPMPSASKLRSESDAAELARIIAECARILGFNMDFAPVVDVVDGPRGGYSNGGLVSRAFGKSADDVVRLAGTFLSELRSCGVVGCIKHFPGLGASQVDSHEELPLVAVSDDEFRSVDLAPYVELIERGGVQAVMVAHAAYPTLALQESRADGKLLPSSLSSRYIDNLLRRELGFEGLVVTDDLEMGAIVRNFGIAEACRLAIAAGADMLAICARPEAVREGFDALAEAVARGEISEARIDTSLARIAGVKQTLSLPLPFDPRRIDELSAAVAELNARLE
ncbi:MAG: glycoside hydrolase family 3 N-terminal domain-containing protein [Pyrinomonadaceae bacterium]